MSKITDRFEWLYGGRFKPLGEEDERGRVRATIDGELCWVSCPDGGTRVEYGHDDNAPAIPAAHDKDARVPVGEYVGTATSGHAWVTMNARRVSPYGWHALLSGVDLESAPSEDDVTSPGVPYPRQHNATCVHCGGPAYMGLLAVECMRPNGCEKPTLPGVTLTTWTRGERVWKARGLGVAEMHPTREGAIAAWRAKVAQR
jgi:hypothetical protein